jgi:hypothetical protein
MVTVLFFQLLRRFDFCLAAPADRLTSIKIRSVFSLRLTSLKRNSGFLAIKDIFHFRSFFYLNIKLTENLNPRKS